MNLLELVAARNIDARTAALLWMAMEGHRSLIIAGAPQRAGKTTTLEAVLEALPAGLRRVDLAGLAEAYDFVPRVKPADTVLVAGEISDHLPEYLWGASGRRAFTLLQDGFSLVATMHADSVAEVIEILTQDLGAERSEVGLVDLVAIIHVSARRGGTVVRRVVALSRLVPDRDGIREVPLVTHETAADRHVHHEDAQASLVDAGELARRTAYLVALAMSGATDARAAFTRHLALGGSTA